MKSITIKAGNNIFAGHIKLPLSKSISNRILMMEAISDGKVQYDTLSEADDTRFLKELLDQIREGEDKHIDAGNTGTSIRFLTAFLALTPGKWILTGDKRMQGRPIGGLVDALRQLDADIKYIKNEGYPPLKISGKTLSKDTVSIYAGTSSQFISALMMIGPVLPGGLNIKLEGDVSSYPYIEMTARLMKQAGAEVRLSIPTISIAGGGYKPARLMCEYDWSAAAAWYQVFTLSQLEQLFIPGLKEDSIQGDRHLADYFSQLGVDTRFMDDGVMLNRNNISLPFIKAIMKDHPDLAPALIVTTAAKGLKGAFKGLESLKIKESDRIEALQTELRKCGIHSNYIDGNLTFEAQKLIINKAIDTYQDHRIAMAFAPLAVLGEPVTINDPHVVSKSYPGFFKQIAKVLGSKEL